MDKEEILALARESRKGNEYEVRTETKSGLLGAFISLLIGIALLVFEYAKRNTVNWSVVAMIMTVSAVQCLHEGIKLKKVLWIVIGSIQAIIALFCILAAIVSIIGEL